MENSSSVLNYTKCCGKETIPYIAGVVWYIPRRTVSNVLRDTLVANTESVVD